MAQANSQQVKKLGDVNATTGLQRWIVNGTNFFLPPKYQIQQVLGSGAYGVVVAALDTSNPNEEENIVAIKKIEKAFEHKVFSQRTLRELKIMRLLKHENVLGCKSILMPRSIDDFNELYVVTDLMETDLTSIIKSNQTLTDEHVQFFIYQILRGLKYVHSSGILHRDLKPRNLLVNANCDLKICDFGLARSNINTLMTQNAQLTDYVVTRWYRAPEVILSYSQYTGAMDIWSIGCILAELLKRKPLMPASTEQEQMMMIAKLVGKPPASFIEQIEGADDRQFMRALPNHRG